MASIGKLFLVVILFGSTYCVWSKNNCKDAWEVFTSAISRGTKEEFVMYTNPLAQMAKNAYTAEVNTTVPGWELLDEFKLSRGLYALAYNCVFDPSKIVIAFRGIRFGAYDSEGTEEDLCARASMMNAGLECSEDKVELPDICSGFPSWVIDYLNQARIFMAQMRAQYPEECFLYTGHSIGSSLAALLSATSGKHYSQAIAFASNPSNLAEIASNLGLENADFSRVISIYDKYDSNAVLDSSSVGVTCRFEDHPQPDACTTCLADGPFPDLADVVLDMDTPCGQCLHVTHAYRHILETIYSEDAARPQCYEQGWVKIPLDKPAPSVEGDVERRLLELLKDLTE